MALEEVKAEESVDMHLEDVGTKITDATQEGKNATENDFIWCDSSGKRTAGGGLGGWCL